MGCFNMFSLVLFPEKPEKHAPLMKIFDLKENIAKHRRDSLSTRGGKTHPEFTELNLHVIRGINVNTVPCGVPAAENVFIGRCVPSSGHNLQHLNAA